MIETNCCFASIWGVHNPGKCLVCLFLRARQTDRLTDNGKVNVPVADAGCNKITQGSTINHLGGMVQIEKKIVWSISNKNFDHSVALAFNP